MKLYIYGFIPANVASETKIRETLKHVAGNTDCRDLVVTLYLSVRSKRMGGRAYVRQWIRANRLHPKGGHMSEFSRAEIPGDLPQQFKLIRMMLSPRLCEYPRTEMDGYLWRHTYNGFYDHLAHLFAHELHHYQRHHLGLHPHKGEHSANQWAHDHVTALGYSIRSEKLQRKKQKRQSQRPVSLAAVFNPADFDASALPGTLNGALKRAHLMLSPAAQKKYIADKLEHFNHLRSLSPGDELYVTFDPNRMYEHQTVSIVRIMRKNSVRIIIRTQDGKEWRWPMAWLRQISP
ncbi:MAG: hypothetical protein U5R06_23130 [candidate division KSB1 bacterium]|nr:hypothetical protein [candidate division KSB1 bacterium]